MTKKYLNIIERKIEKLSGGNKEYEALLKEAFFADNEIPGMVIKKKTKKKATVDEIERLKREKEGLERDLNTQAQDLKAAIVEKEDLLRQYRRIEGDKREAENIIIELEGRINGLEADNNDLRQATETFIETSCKKETEKRTIKSEFEKQKQKLVELEEENRKISGEKTKIEDEKTRLESHLEEYVNSYDNLQSRIEEKEEEIKSLVLENKLKKENEEKIKAEWEEKLREAEELFQTISERNEELLAENTNLIGQLEEEKNI